MKFTYTPEGAKPRSWVFKPNKIMNVEAERIEELTGWSFAEFGEKFMAGSMKAYHVMLYVFMKREVPTVKYEEIQFCLDEIEVDYDDDESAAIIDAMKAKQAAEGLDEDEQAILDQLEADAAPKEVKTD